MQVADRHASKQAILRQVKRTYPYSPSIASSTSSTSSSSGDSVFSADGHSSQSSVPSSPKSEHDVWDDRSWNLLKQSYRANAVAACQPVIEPDRPTATPYTDTPRSSCEKIATSEPPVPPELRVHPRRTQANTHSELSNGHRAARAPPALVRQCERKDIFVESLVGKLILKQSQAIFQAYPLSLEATTTQMIEVIWPLSAVPPAVSGCTAAALGAGGRSLIDLQTFVQEVLKRSKTSYSTLQVALYYLVLVKPHVPRVDFTREQPDDSHATRAMQCGRRMFLAALILASKYLQDRNYSARAWAKISGLQVQEINRNERAFVVAIDYKLHVPEERFTQWTNIVLKYALSSSPPQSPIDFAAAPRPCSSDPTSAAWRALVARLTPALDTVDMTEPPETPIARLKRFAFDVPVASPPRSATFPLPPSVNRSFGGDGQTATPKLTAPEIVPSGNGYAGPRLLPSSPRIPQLPTPQMTPRTNAFYAPAASVQCLGPGPYDGPTMRGAMRQIQAQSFTRCAIDTWPHAAPMASGLLPPFTRAPFRLGPRMSTEPSTFTPQSMAPDKMTPQSRPSRSSSISSSGSSQVTSMPCSTLPQLSRLAGQAAHRQPERQHPLASSLCGSKDAIPKSKPQPHFQKPHPPPLDLTSLREPSATSSARDAATGSALPLTPPSDPLPLPSMPHCVGAAREPFVRGSRPCAAPLQPAASGAKADAYTAAENAAAMVLRSMASDSALPFAHRKRSRPGSIDDTDSALQAAVRKELLSSAAKTNAAPAAKWPPVDELLRHINPFPLHEQPAARPRIAMRLPSEGSLRLRSEDGARKRICCGREAVRGASHGRGMETESFRQQPPPPSSSSLPYVSPRFVSVA